MNPNDSANAVTEMIMSEKERFKKYIESEDWEGMQDEIYYYAKSATEGK